MKYQNNILICVIICISIYFLLSGAIIEGVTVTPEENDKDFSKKSRLYLQGIDDQLTKLGEIRNKKRRTPVNIHIDVGDAQGTKSNVVVENQGKEGYDNFPPTLGNAQENNSNADLEGVGRPDQEKFGLQQRSKNNGDIRNFSKFQSGDHGECHYLPPPPPPVKEVPPCGTGSLGRCSETDHRGCRHARHKLAPPPQIQSQSHGGGISYKEGFAAGDWEKGGAGGAAVEEGEEKKNDGADAGGTGAGGASAGGGGSGSYCQSSNSPKWGCTKTVTESASGNKEFAYKNHKNWKESNKKAVENWKKEEAAKEKKYKEKKKKWEKKKEEEKKKRKDEEHEKKKEEKHKAAMHHEQKIDKWDGSLKSTPAMDRYAWELNNWLKDEQAAHGSAVVPPLPLPKDASPEVIRQYNLIYDSLRYGDVEDSQEQQQDGELEDRYGIKQIVYDRDKMISPKLQKELGVGVHNFPKEHKQVIRQGPKKETWYQWLFGRGGDDKRKHSNWY